MGLKYRIKQDRASTRERPVSDKHLTAAGGSDKVLYGGRGEVVNTSVCGTDMRGFEPRRPPGVDTYSKRVIM